ncbi:Dyp-type peroxidase [Amycolatopsis sp. PS_44_ISF1]|uniref:Dyp-type peroxidase n=1 Tax=Amycolatopsis sp. PS_44_ISF1 TaxID=2974917 RepID=UPI0028E069E3|nr:Dyp-type peroxidase [Amycolatopsis sp. PS_44_ISF1]MDT8914657.1 Dyp-type peroxidase [Amycolatopsis sp. PS_44_ISF1]
MVSAPPKAAVFTALDVEVPDRNALSELFRVMSGAVAGAEVTLAVGASLFDERFGLQRLVPRRLTKMPSFPNDALDSARCDGDLLLQVCAADARSVAEATRRVLEAGGARLRSKWTIDGFRDENFLTADGRPSTRDLFGFREGAGNPDVHDPDLMDQLVWVQANSDEPAWTAGGTYQVVRMIQFAPALWDAEPLTRQEAVIGRRKTDGSPLGQTGETAAFDYATDQSGQAIALDAHIRRANPRTAETERNRILRRGYSYRKDARDEGLIFVCFQQDLERGFATAQRHLNGQALDKYILPFGGGYFFVLPGTGDLPDSYLGKALLDAARA